MTDAADLYDRIQGLHAEAQAVLQDARQIEADAWTKYDGDGSKPREPWADARDLANMLDSVTEKIERIGKIAASRTVKAGVTVGADQ